MDSPVMVEVLKLTRALVENIDPQVFMFLLAGALLMQALVKLSRQKKEDQIEWANLLTSKGQDNREYPDIEKIAKLTWVVASTFFVGYTLWSVEQWSWYPVVVFTIWSVAMLGVNLFSAWARAVVAKWVEKREPAAPVKEQETKP